MSLFVSENYICDLNKLLGQGSFGNVYEGYKRKNGKPVAIKVFKKSVPHQSMKQEFDIMKSVDHENIVKLLSVAQHPQCGPFLVMELCSGKSLLSALEDPQNMYGLEEDEFILLLNHITAGIKYLRANNFIHRDIKPGNILKYISEDGKCIYKLTDFGAARVLQDGESFASIYGTEEYLNPELYGPGVCRTPKHKTFDATADLWSIGATLYHAATGSVPFKPFSGRRDKSTMFRIISTKPSGVISGTQLRHNGAIQWSEQLPDTCLLSVKFRQIITSFLGGLLESDPERRWSFERFFNESNKIISLRRIFIFFVNHLKIITIYLSPDDNYTQLQHTITQETGVIIENQTLLYKNNLFCEGLLENKSAKNCAIYTKLDPIILFDIQNKNSFKINLNFLNTVVTDSTDDIKQLLANEYINEKIIDDVAIINDLCKHTVQLIYNSIIQEQETNILKLKYLIRISCLLKQDKQIIMDQFPTENAQLKSNLQNITLQTHNYTEILFECLSELDSQVDSAITGDVETSVNLIKNMKTCIRSYRKATLKSNPELRTFYVAYINENCTKVSEECYKCDAHFMRLVTYMTSWCSKVERVLSHLEKLKEHIKEWSMSSHKLETGATDAARQEKDDNKMAIVKQKVLNNALKRLQKICDENLQLLDNNSSIIKDANVIISNVRNDVLENKQSTFM